MDSFAAALVLGMALGLADFYACRHLFLTCCCGHGPSAATLAGEGSCDTMADLYASPLPAATSVIVGEASAMAAAPAPAGELTALGIISACFVAGFVMQLERTRRQL